ncbi:MAG TPA: elongation factor G [Clostridiales bacterium]|nr:elongation factor G [Clostridiales bacterium]
MKDYGTSSIRNVCLMGHGGSGKTTMAEAMLFGTGVLDRFGKIPDGNTTLDYDPEEIKRKFSINTALGVYEWKDCKVNLIDTPGYFDFAGEVMQGIRVADSALILLPGKGGVAVGTEKAWAYAKDRKIPRVFVISKMDEENADFDAVIKQLKEQFGKGVTPFQLPVFEGGRFAGIVDALSGKAMRIEKDKLSAMDTPNALAETCAEIQEVLKEAVAETSEALMDKFFSGEDFTPEETLKGIKAGILDASIVPVFIIAAMTPACVLPLMDAINQYLPSPADIPAEKAGTPDEKTVEVKADAAAPFSALVFKTIADPFVGRISMFKVFSGTVKPDTTVLNTTSGKPEKLSQIFALRGKKQLPADKLVAGDIAAVAKLANTFTNDTLCDASRPVILEKTVFPEPALSLAVEPKAKGDEDKIGTGLHKLLDEDPTFKTHINTETHQTLISGMGEQHLDVIISKLKAKFNVSVNLVDPKVPYRETIRKKVKVEGKHKKQSGGHGQYGHVWMEFEHGDTEDLVFEEKIFGGAVPRQYFPAVEKGLREAIQRGVLARYPVVNLKATLVDGSYHDVDSSEMSFKIAAQLAYKNGLPQAGPVMLEPIVHVEVYIPDYNMGDIIGDLNKRRGRIMGMNQQEDGSQQVVAEVPMAEMFKYANDLRSMTQGRGWFKQWFERYEEAPAQVAQKIIEEAKKTAVEEEED